MISCQGTIEYLPNSTNIEAVIIDVSSSLEKFGLLLDALANGRLKEITISNNAEAPSIRVCMDNITSFLAQSQELRLNLNDISHIKNMIFDVAIGSMFGNYHLDMEISTAETIVDLSIIFS